MTDPTHPALGPSSTELAAASRRARRRARDRRALVWAFAITLGTAGLLYGAGSLWISSLPEKTPRTLVSTPSDPEPPEAAPGPEGSRPAPRRPGVISTPLDETPDLPVLRQLADQGITLGAEGLPEIRGSLPPDLAGRLSCRFAYGVWELSPNRRFRFLTTCGSESGRVWVGAYVPQGTRVHTSALRADGMEWTTVFDLEKPARIETRVGPEGSGSATIHQKITAVRPGLNGEAFRTVFRERNPIQVGAPSPSAPPAPPSKTADPSDGPVDPLLELLRP